MSYPNTSATEKYTSNIDDSVHLNAVLSNILSDLNEATNGALLRGRRFSVALEYAFAEQTTYVCLLESTWPQSTGNPTPALSQRLASKRVAVFPYVGVEDFIQRTKALLVLHL